MAKAPVFKILFEDGGYFTAIVDEGWVRIGMKGIQSFDLPPGHPDFWAVRHACAEDVENLFDMFFLRYNRPTTDGFA